MTTTLDIVDTLFARLDASALKTAINGNICKHRRDPNSTSEDVVINSLPVNNEQLSRAVANVNVHVPDIEVTVNGQQDKQPNHPRLKQLAGIAVTALNDVWETNKNYTVQQQTLIRDADAGDHYINIRIEFNIVNL